MSRFKVGEKVLVEGVVTREDLNTMDVEVRAGGEVYNVKDVWKGDATYLGRMEPRVKKSIVGTVPGEWLEPVVEKYVPEYSLGQVVLYQGEVCYVTHIERKSITSIHPGEDDGHVHYTVSSIGTGREQKVVYPEFLNAYDKNACYSEDVHDLARITKKYVDFLM